MRTQTSLVFGILASLMTAQSFNSFANAEKSFVMDKLFKGIHKHQTPAAEHPFVAHLEQSVPSLSTVQFLSYNLPWIQTQVASAANATISASAARLIGTLNLDKNYYNPNETVFIEVSLLNAQTRNPVVLSAAD